MPIIRATTAEHISAVRELFLEYAASLDFNLCFQSFEQEVASLPGSYAQPNGALLLAIDASGQPLGCVAMRLLGDGVCEMKRLYVRPSARGTGLGLQLANAIITEGRTREYTTMRLDTVPGTMDKAIAMYRRLGFREIAPYTHNPVPGALYFELSLQ